MKFNLFLLAVFTSLASAIPFSYKENGKARFGCNKYDIDCKAAQSKVGRLNSKIPISNKKNGNQYFGCNKFDIGCKIKQSKLCYNEVYNCYNNKYKKYMDCVKLANYCNDIWFNNNNYYKPTPSQITTQIPTQVTTQITTEIPTEIPTNQEPQPAQPNEPITNSFKPTKENVKIIGRAKYIDDSLWVCNVDSGIEFKINGKSATIVVSTDSIYGSLGADTPARLLVYGDGKVVLDVLTQEETSELNVEFDEAGEHTVHLMKTTECQHGSIYINEIKTDSEVITPTPAKSKKIEFVGDSITAAVGALTKECEYFSTQSDGSYSYALKVAQKLDADYSIYAYGGFGVYGEPRKGHEYLIPPLYEKLGYLNWNADHPENTTLPMNTVDWDGSEFEPDLIFVNVGTNDAFYIRGISKDQQEEEQINFSNAYKDFIAQIRSVHPNAEILCTLGMMGQFLYEEIENAVDAYVKETKDDKVRAFPLSEENLELNGPGFSGHPSIFSHVFAANEAIEKIEELYGWKSDPNVDISEKVNSNPNGNN